MKHYLEMRHSQFVPSMLQLLNVTCFITADTPDVVIVSEQQAGACFGFYF